MSFINILNIPVHKVDKTNLEATSNPAPATVAVAIQQLEVAVEVAVALLVTTLPLKLGTSPAQLARLTPKDSLA